MFAPKLTINSDAIAQNWQSLNELSSGKAAAVIKADAYGLGMNLVAPTLWNAGARMFFVATIVEAQALSLLLPQAIIYDLSGFSAFFTDLPTNIRPVLNTMAQLKTNRHTDFALQFDTGMTRLGFDIAQLDALTHLKPSLIMSHLACSDEPDHPMNASQLTVFKTIRAAFPNVPASFSATGGILLGSEFQFELTRPGIGIYGGAPFIAAKPTVQMSLPIIGTRDIKAGTRIGYGGTFTAPHDMRVATLLGGYADGLLRTLSGKAKFFAGDQACPILGRVSMDAITINITTLNDSPTSLDLFHPTQTLNDLANIAGTIPYEILTSIGARYERNFSGQTQ